MPQAGAYWLATGTGLTTISQTFKDSAGDTLAFSGWYKTYVNYRSSSNTNYCSSVSILFDNKVVASATATTLIPWTVLSAGMVATGSATLSISVNGGVQSTYPYFATALDSFSVVDTSPPKPVTEPGAAALLALALLALSVTQKRKRSLSFS